MKNGPLGWFKEICIPDAEADQLSTFNCFHITQLPLSTLTTTHKGEVCQHKSEERFRLLSSGRLKKWPNSSNTQWTLHCATSRYLLLTDAVHVQCSCDSQVPRMKTLIFIKPPQHFITWVDRKKIDQLLLLTWLFDRNWKINRKSVMSSTASNRLLCLLFNFNRQQNRMLSNKLANIVRWHKCISDSDHWILWQVSFLY